MNKEKLGSGGALCGERAHAILLALARDPIEGRRLLAELRAEAAVPQAQEAQVELNLLQELMRGTRSDGLQAIATMRDAAGITLH
jgi:hypothetical protein